MARNSSGVNIEFKLSINLILLSALTLFLLVTLQFSFVTNKVFLYFFGQLWTVAWIMSFILLLTISGFFIKERILKIIFGFIIILATITSSFGLIFDAVSKSFIWHNTLIPTLIAYIISFIGSILWLIDL